MLLDELESPPEGMDEETYRAFRQQLHERFSDLTKQLKARQEDLDRLAAQPAQNGRQDVSLLDRLPQIGRSLRHSPPEIQRDIYDAFRLQIIYSHKRHEAQLKVTITDETADRVTRATRINGNADLLGAPGKEPTEGNALNPQVNGVWWSDTPSHTRPETNASRQADSGARQNNWTCVRVSAPGGTTKAR